jgi:hypothetical protein
MDLLNRRDDLRVRPAATDVAAHPFAYFVVREPGRRHGHVFRDVAHVAAARLFEQADGRANLPRRAVPALEAVILDEGRLHRVELLPLRQPLDRRDLPALQGGGEGQARQDAPPVNEHRAGPALALVAPLLRAGQLEPFAQGVEQHHARIDFEGLRRAVDLHYDLDGIFHRGCRGEHRVGRRTQRGERVLMRQQVEGEPSEAACDRLPQERASRQPDVGHRRHLL